VPKNWVPPYQGTVHQHGHPSGQGAARSRRPSSDVRDLSDSNLEGLVQVLDDSTAARHRYIRWFGGSFHYQRTGLLFVSGYSHV
jgi:hypothetical protein